MEGANGDNEVPRPPNWYDLGAFPLPFSLDVINGWRRDLRDPAHWRRVRQQQREAERQRAAEDERRAEEERRAVEERRAEQNLAEDDQMIEGGLGGDDQVATGAGQGPFLEELVIGDLEEELIEEAALCDDKQSDDESKAGGDAETEGLEDLDVTTRKDEGGMIFSQEEVEGLMEDGGNKEDDVNAEGEETGHDKNDRSNNDVQDPVRPKKKKRTPVIIPAHVTVTLLPGQPPKYRCNLCQKSFKTKHHVSYHLYCDKSQVIPKPFQCPHCNQGFINKGHYQYHLNQHNNQRPYNCHHCHKGFFSQGKLNRHLSCHSDEKPFLCHECPRSYKSNKALKSHVKKVHGTKKTSETPSETTSEITSEITSQTTSETFSFPCSQCPEGFATIQGLTDHALEQHAKPLDVQLNPDHNLEKKDSDQRPHACHLCSWSFSTGKDLRRHLLIHTDVRPFKCGICGQAFKRKDNLARHIKGHKVVKEETKQLANNAEKEETEEKSEDDQMKEEGNGRDEMASQLEGVRVKEGGPSGQLPSS